MAVTWADVRPFLGKEALFVMEDTDAPVRGKVAIIDHESVGIEYDGGGNKQLKFDRIAHVLEPTAL